MSDHITLFFVIQARTDEIALCIEQQVILPVVVDNLCLVSAIGFSFDVLNNGTGVVPVDVIDDFSLDVSRNVVVIILIAIDVCAYKVALCIEQQVVLSIVVDDLCLVCAVGLSFDVLDKGTGVVPVDVIDDFWP